MSALDLSAFSAGSEALVAAAAPRVVSVSDGRRRLSGVIWSAGRIVTAEECLAEEEGLTVTLPDGRRLPAELVGRDPSTDVALLGAETGPVADWPVADIPGAGALAWVVGRGGHGPRAAFGMVAEAGPEWTSAAGGRIDARVRVQLMLPPAIEGGAVIDAAGRLVGLAVADPRRRTLVIPAATVARATEALAARGYVGRGYLGLALQPIRRGGGLIAVEIAEGGPAAAAGLLVGDIVTTWEGEELTSMRGLTRRLGPDSAGRTVRLGLIRAGQPMEVGLVVGERRPKAGRDGHVAEVGA